MIRKFFGVAFLLSMLIGQGLAQNPFYPGWQGCIDPDDDEPFSDNYNYFLISTPLMGVAVGEVGTWSLGEACFGDGNAFGINVSGGIGFMVGEEGSVQSTFDDSLQLTFGMPFGVGNNAGYAAVDTGAPGAPILTRFGAGQGFSTFFSGESDRYLLVEQLIDGVLVTLYIDIIGDAIRMEWQLQNTGAATGNIGLWFGQWPAMRTWDQSASSGFGVSTIDDPSVGHPHIITPGLRPTRLETRWFRSQDPSIFPTFVNLNFDQSLPFGYRLENEASPATTDPETGESEVKFKVDEFALGLGAVFDSDSLLGPIEAVSTFPNSMFPPKFIVPGMVQSDFAFLVNPASGLKGGAPGWIQKWYPTPVAAGDTKTIVQYVRSLWGVANYAPPYSAVVDAPRLVNYEESGLNELTPNPATIRVWVDNTRGFSSAEREFQLQNVTITLDLTNSTGISLVGGGKQQTQSIARIDPRQMASVDFSVQIDETAIGHIPYTVRIDAPPGPKKTLNGTIHVSVTPRVKLLEGANLLSMPWRFDDTAWSSILGLSQPSEFQAFVWDPIQQGYVITTSAERGKSAWIVLKQPIPDPNNLRPLANNPEKPEDSIEGAPLIDVVQGWNMIGNPYEYPVPLGQLLGVARANPTTTFTWKQLVDGGMVNGGLAYWDSTTKSYKFITGINDNLVPHVGYWIHVNDAGVVLKFPPVFLEGALTREASSAPAWKQTDKQWRLQLVARSGDEIDDQNYIGVAAGTREAKSLTLGEPPMGPTQKISVGLAPLSGTGTREAYSFTDKADRQEWTMLVESKEAGPVTLTWPNMGTVPKNVRFRLTDVATGATRDMRRVSGYTFEAAEGTTRELKLQIEPGAVSRAVIGNVVVSQPGRDRNRTAPFTISYTLSSDATTTVRVLGPNGREVYTATRGRADRAGENTVTWALRDSANRAVAPGTYRIEIIAETEDGERVRKIVPVNVVR